MTTDITKLFKNEAYFHDDMLKVRALKNSPINKRKLPLCENWRRSPALKKEASGRYFCPSTKDNISSEEYNRLDLTKLHLYAPISTYSLNHSALKHIVETDRRRLILQDVRIEAENNHFTIMLSGILTAKPCTSRLKLLADTIEALVRVGVIEFKGKEQSLKTRVYKILRDYFPVSLCTYEIRFDAHRDFGCFLYESAKINSEHHTEDYNTVPLSSPQRATVKRNGYRVTVYDRAMHKDNTGQISSSKHKIEDFPIRYEVRLVGEKLFKALGLESVNELSQGSPTKIMTRLKEEVAKKSERALRKYGLVTQFDYFCNAAQTKRTPKENILFMIANRSLEGYFKKGSVNAEALRYHGLLKPRHEHYSII